VGREGGREGGRERGREGGREGGVVRENDIEKEVEGGREEEGGREAYLEDGNEFLHVKQVAFGDNVLYQAVEKIGPILDIGVG
jgi:hypothetical protein